MTSLSPQEQAADERFAALKAIQAEVAQLTSSLDAINEQMKQTTLAVQVATIRAIPPHTLTNHWEEDRKRREAEELAKAADGTGPQPFDRDWYTNGCVFHDVLASDPIGWHQSNELLTILSWAAHSYQGHQALNWEGDPALNPHQHTVEIYRELEAALKAGAMEDLIEQADRLGFDSDLIRNH